MADRKKPLPKTERRLKGRELNRGLQRGRGSETNQRKDNVKNISVGLMDVDAAIMYYFNEVIKPKVVINKQEIKVPVYYANAERWNSIQKQGYVRDVKGSLITPLIVFKRTSIEADETLPIDKLDANDPKQFYTFEKKYSQQQRYDRFSVEDATEMGDNERIIKTNFNMSFKGYLVPESFNEFLTTQRHFTPKQVVVEDESGLVVSSLFSPDREVKRLVFFQLENHHYLVD